MVSSRRRCRSLPDSKDTSLERGRGIGEEVEVIESIDAELVAVSVGEAVRKGI
jgi:hypothetical protein